MDTNSPPQFRGRPFFPGGGFEHHGGGSTLAWVIFALQLLMLAALATLLARSFMGRRGPGRSRFVRHFGPPGPPRGRGPNGLEVAQMRYASGDLSRDEYLQIVRDLGGEAEAPTGETPSPAGP